MTQSLHIGIVACSAEGAALCYRTICDEGPAHMGEHRHPEVSMHTHCLGDYMDRIHRDDWKGVADLMLSSAEKLQARGILSSMGEVGNAYDNALAERVNGILKQEYRLDARFVSPAQAQRAVQQAIWLYNYERPHLALKYQKPHQVYINATRFSLN